MLKRIPPQRLIIILLAAALVFAVRGCSAGTFDRKRIISTIGYKDSVIAVYRDAFDRQHNELVERKYSLMEMEYSHDSALVALRHEFGRTLKDLQSRTAATIRTKDTVTITVTDTVVLGDTARFFNYRDEWARIQGTVYSNKAHLDYSFDTGVTLDRKWVRDHWYAKKNLILDVTVSNPKASLIGIQTYTIEPDRPKWYQTRGFQIGAGFLAGYILAPK